MPAGAAHDERLFTNGQEAAQHMNAEIAAETHEALEELQ
jgi:hypothetical protein